MKFWVRKIQNLGHSLKIVFLGQIYLNSTITASRALSEQVLLAKKTNFCQNRLETPFAGTCPGRPNSRLYDVSKWTLWMSPEAQILFVDYCGLKMLMCVFSSLVDSFGPKMRGAKIAILTNFTFLPKIVDFTKCSFEAVPGL